MMNPEMMKLAMEQMVGTKSRLAAVFTLPIACGLTMVYVCSRR